MRKAITVILIAGFGVALLVAAGCEDTPLVAGKDYSMVMSANPPNVNLDSSNPNDSKTSTMRATVLSDTGIPQKGFVVYFSADGGTLASAGNGVTTDSSGTATDTLTIVNTDPATITVSATSSTLSASAKVTKNDPCTANTAPVARITGNDPNPAAAGTDVTFTGDASSSTDADGQVVAWQWDCGTNPPQTGTTQTMTCHYTVQNDTATKAYSVTLIVSDDGLGGSAPYQCQKPSTMATKIVTVTKSAN